MKVLFSRVTNITDEDACKGKPEFFFLLLKLASRGWKIDMSVCVVELGGLGGRHLQVTKEKRLFHFSVMLWSPVLFRSIIPCLATPDHFSVVRMALSSPTRT